MERFSNRNFRINRVWPASQPCLLTLAFSLYAFFVAGPAVFAQQTEAKPDEKATKYHAALRKRPSSGYLFDRFFNAWLDTGTVDGLAEFLKEQSGAPDATAADRLLHGYFLVKLGRESEAIAVFESALKADPGNTAAWAGSARASARMLDFSKALADLEQALETGPKEDLAIELGKLKGRWLSRSGKTGEALAAWKELAEAHPGDDELREDLVDLQLAESLVDEALATQEALVESTSDPYLKITRKLRLGDIYLRAGETEDARSIYRGSLDAAGRETWLEKEILAQIEQLFRREDDLSGLKQFYAELAAKEPGRIAVLRRRALVLAELEEADEAIGVFREILRITPGDRGNRESFVDLLGRLGKTREAVEQMTALTASHPDDAELVVRLAMWQNAAEQPAAARDSVMRYLEMSDRSEYAHLRAARMLEQFEQTDAAGEVLDQLIAAFPDSLSAVEERAAFLYRLGKKDEAIAVWQQIAREGSNQDAIRAARMLSSRGQREKAYEILKQRADDFASDPVFLGRLCEEAMASDHAAEAIPWIEKRLALVTAPGDLSEALRQATAILERAEETENYREKLRTGKELTVAQSCLLSELLERNGEYEAAEAQLRPLMERGEKMALHQRSRQLESRNEWEEAAKVMRQIIELPGGRRSNYLERLVKLYRRGFNYDDALTWTEAWKELSPGSTRPWLEQARIQNEDGKPGDAIETLRRAAGRFEDEETVRTQLASFYRQEGKFADAERIYWNLYEESPDAGSKVRWAANLALMASEQGQVDRLVEQLEERRRANRTSIAPLLAIAEVHRRSGDYESRREALLEATRLRPEDLNLLHEIAVIEEQEGDWERAADTLESALPLDKTERTRRRIALLHLRYGDEEEGFRRFMELQGGDSMDADGVLGVADAFITRSAWERARDFLDEHRERFPDDYRIAYLYAVVLEECRQDDRAVEAFLELLTHEKEIAAVAGATAPTVSRSTANRNYYGDVPDGFDELREPSSASYSAFRYRTELQSGRRRSPSGFTGTAGGLVNLPQSLKNLRAYTLIHLHWLAQSLGEEEGIRSIALAMGQRGVRDPELILAMQYSFPGIARTRRFDADLLERFPDNPALTAAAVVDHVSNLRNREHVADERMMRLCYETLEKDFPQLALTAAICAAASRSDEDFDLLRRALEAAPEFELPSGLLSSAAGSLLLIHAGEDFPADLDRPLSEKIRTWHQIQRRELAGKNRKNPLIQFSISDQYAAILRKSDDLSEFAAYLDGQCADYARAIQGSGLAASTQSAMGRYLQYMTRDQPMLSPLQFPPLELPGLPPNVLIQFIETPFFSFGYQTQPIFPAAAANVAGEVKDPVLAALFLNLAGEVDATGQKIEALLAAATGERKRPPLREGLLAAAWYQKTEQWEKAAEVLEAVRLVPMSQALRRRIDAALVASAVEANLKPEAIQAADAEGLAKWGPAAALRLRYGFLSPQQRGELVASLQTFGFEQEAGRLEVKGTAPAGPSIGGVVTAGAGSAKGVYEQVETLLKDGKADKAEKLLVRSLEQSTRQLTISGYVRWDYELIELVRNLRQRKSGLLDKIIEEAVPAPGAKASEHLHYAALLELEGRFKEAAGAFRTALPLMPKSNRDKFALRMAILRGMLDPQGAAEDLREIDGRELAQAGNLTESLLQIHDYGSSRSQSDARARLNLGRTFAHWLRSAKGDPAIAKIDLSWVERFLRSRLIQRQSSLPDLYLTEPFRQLGYTQQFPDQEKDRRDVHDRLCRAMTFHPQLARTGFSSLACLRIGENPDTSFTDLGLVGFAEEALANFAERHPSLPAPRSSNWSSQLRNDMLPLWNPEEFLLWHARLTEAGIAAAGKVLSQVKESKDRDTQKLAEAFFRMCFGEPDEFAEALQSYLGGVSATMNIPVSHAAGSADHAAKSRARKAHLIWRSRREELGDTFEMEDFLIGAIRKSRQAFRNETSLLASLYLHDLAEKEGWPAANEYLLKLTELWLGDRKRWERFKKEPQRRVAGPGGRSYYQGGDFTDPVHKQFAAFLTGCGWDPLLVYNVVEFADKNGLDHGNQISQLTLLSRMDSSGAAANPDFVRNLFRHSPFLESVENFRTGAYRENSDPTFLKLLNGVPDWEDANARSEFREMLAGRDTFGARLALAWLDDKKTGNAGPKKVPAVLAAHRAEIEALPASPTEELATLVTRMFPKGVPSTGLSGEDIATLDYLGAEQAKSALDEAEEFLQVKSLTEIGVDDTNSLRSKLGPLVDPLLKNGKWDVMEKVFWHAVDLAAIEQKKGTWSSYRNTWRFSSSFIYTLLDKTPGGGLERVAFYERLIRNDTERKIAVVNAGMRFDQHLKQAFDAAGGLNRMEDALDTIVGKFWDLSGGEGPQSHAGLMWMYLGGKFNGPQYVQAIAWADKNSEGREWSPLAREIAMVWRMGMRSSVRKELRAHWSKIPHFDAWEAHYVSLLDDESLTVPWRINIARELCDGAPNVVGPETVHRSTQLLADSMIADGHFSGWAFFHIAQEFCELPEDERWIETANRLHEGWVFKNRHNEKDHSFGLSWYPWDELVFQMLDVYGKLGDPEKLNRFRKESNAAGHLKSTARTIYTLVEHGFFEEAIDELSRATDYQDIGTDYPNKYSDYSPRYDSKVHEQLPGFLETIEKPGLRLFAEVLILGAPDLPPDQREKNLPYLLRNVRLFDAAKRFPETDFEGDDELRRHTLRQLAVFDNTSWYLKKELAETSGKTNLEALPDSKKYRRIEYDIRIPAAHAGNRARTGDLEPAHRFLHAMNTSGAESYYRRKAIEHFSLRLAESVRNRAHNMPPKDIRGHADALHLLVKVPKDELIGHGGLQSAVIAKVAAEIFASRAEGVVSQLKDSAISEVRQRRLASALYAEPQPFWNLMTHTIKVKVPNEDIRPDDAERRWRVEAILAHPIVRNGLETEKDLWSKMQKNRWVKAEERESEWGIKLMEPWQKKPTTASAPEQHRFRPLRSLKSK